MHHRSTCGGWLGVSLRERMAPRLLGIGSVGWVNDGGMGTFPTKKHNQPPFLLSVKIKLRKCESNVLFLFRRPRSCSSHKLWVANKVLMDVLVYVLGTSVLFPHLCEWPLNPSPIHSHPRRRPPPRFDQPWFTRTWRRRRRRFLLGNDDLVWRIMIRLHFWCAPLWIRISGVKVLSGYETES